MSSATALLQRPTETDEQDFSIRSFDGPLGAEINGLDLNLPVSAQDVATIRAALVKHGLVVFRNQRITPEQHVAFSRRFGPLQVHVLNRFHLKQHPEILNMSNAYDTLPADVKQTLEGRKAVHSYVYRYRRLQALTPWRPDLTQKQIDDVPEVEHPIIRTHPENGRKALFVSEGFTSHIVGIPKDESDALLKFLHEHTIRAENVYTHKWRAHDIVFWDNRSTVHYAAITPQHLRRTLYRTTVEGDVPF